MFQLDVEPGKDVVIDNSHVVCWDNSLKYEISVTTGGGASGGIGGFLGNIVSNVTSGEGIVLRFSGSGKVFICSRNRDAFLRNGQPAAKVAREHLTKPTTRRHRRSAMLTVL